MTPQALARKDHTRNRLKNGAAIAAALGLNWRDLDTQEQNALRTQYMDAWWMADTKAEATA